MSIVMKDLVSLILFDILCGIPTQLMIKFFYL